ncbi:hypothetical protein BCON_0170g00010 [Botryotinia convoluta]|uniref:Uncharacterized protein n=1 Tax=Botryotinia convoluta TaxID=54673 RepID=A0A4Z1I261_9HELO|nr:hypothetical protein BCON_0170g00010 [Botryotinia convoluta]
MSDDRSLPFIILKTKPRIPFWALGSRIDHSYISQTKTNYSYGRPNAVNGETCRLPKARQHNHLQRRKSCKGHERTIYETDQGVYKDRGHGWTLIFA